ncbi:MAG: hypothetical protein WCJ56_05160 [bacterium]
MSDSTPQGSPAYPAVILTDVVSLAEKLGIATVRDYSQTRGVVAVRAICLQAAGCEEADYESVMTISGWGTCFAYHPQKFFLVYFGPLDPQTQDSLLAKAYGRQWVWIPRGDTPEDTWQLLRQLLDAGTPVEGEHRNEILFVGYQDAEKIDERKICVCAPFAWKAEWWTWQQFTEWWDKFHCHCHLQYVGDATQAAPAVETATTVINNILTFACNDGRAQVDFMKAGRYGLAGIEAMANDVENMELAPEKFDAAWYGCHAILPQIAGRHCTAQYLRRQAGLFPPTAAQHLRAAAAEYEQAYTDWGEFLRQLGSGSLDELKLRWAEASYRNAGAAAIRAALAHEQAAIAAIEQMLASADAGKNNILDVPGYRYIQDGFNPFTLALKACLTFLGDARPYDEVLADSGACFRMAWNHTRWDEGNMDLAHLGIEPMRRAVQCAGYNPRFLLKPDWLEGLQADDLERVPDDAAGKKLLREAIIASIDRGIPVLAFGVVGPPEVSVIAGYGDEGEVMFGWSFVNDLPEEQREPNGMFRQRAWWKGTPGIILLDATVDEVTVKQLRDDTLEWAYRVMTMPKGETNEFGEAAYKGWAFAMIKDSEFPEGDEQTLASRRNTFWDAIIMQAERGAAADILESKAEQQPPDTAAHLREAARHLREEFELCGRAQTAIGGEMLPSAGLADPVKRRAAVDVFLQCRDHYVQATKHLALALGKVPPYDIHAVKELDGLRPAFRWMTLLGTVLGCMRYTRNDIEAAWLYGISGAAFMLNIDRQVDVSGPTSWDVHESFAKMLPYLGFTIDAAVSGEMTDADFDMKQQAARAFITAKVDAGIPCVGWDGGFPEYVTINGYTSEAVLEWTHYIAGGYRVMPWEQFGRNDTNSFHVFSVEPVPPPGDERAAIVAALQFALQQRVTDKPLDDNHASGMQGYDLWLRNLETGDWRNNHFWGVHHNVACWGECRAYAEAFLRLAGQKLSGELQPLFEQAADHYKIVRTSLGQMQAVFRYQYPQPPVSAEGEKKATILLRAARDAEMRGLTVIEQIVTMMGSK